LTRKRILILSEPFGMGHTMAANAIKEHINEHEPDYQVEILELTRYLKPTLSQWMCGAYLLAIQHSPHIWRYFYHKSRYQRVWPQLWTIVHHLIYAEVASILRRYQPDCIICTHPFPSAIVSRLKQTEETTALLCTVVTDYGVHATWLSPQVDIYFLPSQAIKRQINSLGIEDAKLVVTGIPISAKFLRKHPKDGARRQLGLLPIPTLLCMGGGLGKGFSDELIQALSQCLEQVQVLFVVGKNRVLYDRLAETIKLKHANFHLYGFVDNIDMLMDASDLLITKPGGITCTEAVAKRLPMLLLPPLPGQEDDNYSYMIEQGYGVGLSDINSLPVYVYNLSQNSKSQSDDYIPNLHVEYSLHELISI